MMSSLWGIVRTVEIRGGRRGTTTLPLLATGSAIHGHPIIILIPRKVALVAAEHELPMGTPVSLG